MDQDKQADAHIINVMANNLKTMYHQGVKDGVTNILVQVASNFKQASDDKDCPQELKEGLIQAATFLLHTAKGSKYEIIKKQNITPPT